MAEIEGKPRVTTRPKKRTPEEYRSSVLDMLGFSSPYEHAITQVRTDIAIERPAADVDVDTHFPRIGELPRTASPGEDAAAEGLVQRLWQASEAVDQDLVIEDWGPEAPLDRTVGRYGWAWWPVLLGALVIGTILLIMSFRSIPAGQADDLRQDWSTAALQVQATVPDARDAAAIITDPVAGPTELATARNSLIVFDGNVAALERLVSEPFPTPPPLASGDAFDALKAPQSDLLAATEIATDIEARLSDAITYRNLLEQSFVLPALPIAADEVTRADLGQQIAVALSSTREQVRQLPIGPSFDAHRASAQALLTRLETWQASYLDALRLSDIDAATALKVEITNRISLLRSRIQDPLQLVAVSVDNDLDEMDALLESAIADLEVVE
jgi:hypothetical protein